jgi:hypothetical protein
MANDENNGKERAKITVPYVSWRTFESFLESITKAGTPSRIDPTVLHKMSGSAQSQLLGTLRFLALISADGTPTPFLHQLVDVFADSDKRKIPLGNLFDKAYRPILKDDFSVATGTVGQLRDRFRESGGVEGDTVEKAIRFYLTGIQTSGAQISPYLKVRQRAPRSGGPRRATIGGKSAANKIDDELGGEGYEPPDGTFEIPLNIIGQDGAIFLPEDITVERWKRINQYVEMVIDLRPKNSGDTD